VLLSDHNEEHVLRPVVMPVVSRVLMTGGRFVGGGLESTHKLHNTMPQDSLVVRRTGGLEVWAGRL
jgi:hypothetical protein